MSSDQPPLTKAEQAVQRLNAEVTLHEDFDHNRSILGKAVDYFYDKDASTLEALKKLQSEVQEAQKSSSPDGLNRLTSQIESGTDADSKTLHRKETITSLGTGFVKSAFLFMPGAGKARSATIAAVGLLGTAVTWGLDQAKADDSKQNQFEDFALGAVKGVATQKIMGALGAKTGDPLLTGTLVGMSGRVLDSTLNRQTWSTGVQNGLTATFANSFTADAVRSDLAMAGMAVALHKTVGRLGNIENNPLGSNITAGFSFGTVSGVQGELQRQDASGEKRSWRSALAMGLAQGSVDGVAAVPGGLAGRAAILSNLEKRPVSEPAKERTTGVVSERPVVSPGVLDAALNPQTLGKPLESIVKNPANLITHSEVPAIKLENTTKGQSVSDILRSVHPDAAGDHNLNDYARAMEGYPVKATSINHIGGDTVGLNLTDGNVLKLTTRPLPTELRPFDMPITEKGSKPVDHVTINYFVQPKGEPTVSPEQYANFVKEVARQGYWLSDPGVRNTMNYPAENRVALVDPFAVEKLPDAPSTKNGGTPVGATIATVENSGVNSANDSSANPGKDLPGGAGSEIKPFNVFSLSDEPAGRLTSNFADTPFTFNNRRYKSFESFYQSLKFSDAKTRSEVAKLPGKQAKDAGSKSHATETTFNGQTFQLGSAEHHQLLEQALWQKFIQNPGAAKALVETLPRPIIHDTGRVENPNTRLPADDFTRMLTDIREKLSTMDLNNLSKRK